ncbi:MAG: hypothetical protein RLN62_06430 [Rickettsiales bacterium]
MALIDTGKTKIQSLDHHGCGIAKSDSGEKLAIQYTLPGEVVEYEIHKTKYKKNAVLSKHIEKSPERAADKCAYYTQCGGCLLQHANEDTYNKIKTGQIEYYLRENKLECDISPIQSVGTSARRRANFEYAKKDEKSFLGFHKYRLNQIIDIKECPSVRKEISDILPDLKALCDEILENKQRANIYVTIANNGLDILIRLKKPQEFRASAKDMINRFFEKTKSARVKISNKKSILAEFKTEDPYINFDGISVKINPDSFLQSSYESDEILLNLAKKYLAPQKDDFIADLFCGRGTFSIPLSRICKIDSYESDKDSLAALDVASLNHSLNIKTLQRDLFQAPLFLHELKKYNKVIINPPRAGALNQIKELAASSVSQICYISCNPETFARDAKILVNAKYKLKSLTPVDQFVWNPHIEVVAHFEK